MRPRLLVVALNLNMGGTERHLLQILPGLQRDFDIRLMLMRRGDALEPAMRAAGIEVYVAWSDFAPLRLLTGLLRIWTMVTLWRPHVVHFFLPEAYLIGSIATRLAPHRSRLVMSRRSMNNYQSKHRIMASLERWLHPGMDVLLGNSGIVVDQLVGEGAPMGRVGLIYNGIVPPDTDDGQRAGTRLALGVAPGTVVLTIVANLIPYKGHADLIDALSRIVAAGAPSHFLLLCVGRDDGLGAMLKAAAEKAGLSDRIRWLGQRTDVGSLLAASDIGLLVSHEEGMSNAILEGMAAGLPMIVTGVGGNAETVGQAGIVVPPKNPAALADALNALLADPARREELGRAARQRVASSYSMEACLRQYERLYRALADGCSGEAAIAQARAVLSPKG